MNVLDVFGQPTWRNLVFALLHTLWQGGLIALATATALRWLSARHQGARYLIALGGQFGVLLAGLLTWSALGYEPPTRPVETRQAGAVAIANTRPDAGPVESVTARPLGDMTEPPVAPNWVPIVAMGWLAGVVLMLARTVASALAAVGLTRGAGPVDAAIRDAVEALRREMGVGRRVRVVSCPRCPGPAVLGLVWPTLVLPVSMMTGLSPEALRAILAHELEHIRRYDYVVNLAQMAVESVLFFNPAVWWLGRQARVEREACCDAAAVRLTGRPLEYSRVLADWAERVRGTVPAVAIAWSGEGRASTLRERVIRVLRPGETPTSRVSPTGLAALLVAAPLLLFALSCGAKKAVDLAAQALPAAERVEKLKEAKAEYAPPEITGEGKATLKGTLRAPGGKPLAKPVPASSIIKTGGGSAMSSLEPLKDTFSIEVNPGVVWLLLTPEEFAPAKAGPFDARPGKTVEGIVVVFEPGFPAKVRVVDETGAPVVGANVSGGLVAGPGTIYTASGLVTDGDGVVTVAHASREPYRISAKAKGFQVPEASRDLTLSPSETTTLTLVHAHPARGVVVGPDGAPVVGARIRPYAKFRPHNSYQYGPSEAVMATTDQDGRFNLDALDDGADYVMLIETDHHGRRTVQGVRAGQEGLKWSVGPELTISGTIKGDLSALEKERGRLVVDVEQKGRKQGADDGGRLFPIRSTVPVERVEGGGGRFKVTGVIPGEVVVKASDHTVTLDVEKPDNPVTIDLTEPPPQPTKRRVIIRVNTPDGAGQATGSVEGYATDAQVDRVFQHYNVPLKGGEASFEMPVPGRASYQSRSVLGYWFKDGDFEVPPGDGPLLVEVKAVPAGAIVGRVVEPDGKPAVSGVSLGVATVEKAPGLKQDDFLQLNNVNVDREGRFFLGPLPIGGTYVVVAGRGHNKQVSQPVRLDGSKATGQAELKMARPASAGGRVVGPDGKPHAGVDVTLSLNHPHAGTSWSPPTETDGDGRFQFDDLSPDLGTYEVKIDSRAGYVPAAATLKPGGPPVEVRLERGRVVTGRVVDAKTGWPIPGAQVYVTPRPFQPGGRYRFDPEGPTDEQGRFRFSNLPPGVFQLNDENGLQRGSMRALEVSTDRAGPVEIRGTLPAWSKLRPVNPSTN